MIRNWVKSRVAGVLSHTGMDRVVGSLAGAGRVPVVIAYHRVVEDFAYSVETSIPSMLVSLRTLERHLDWIGRRFRFVSLDELGERLESGAADKPISAITFDDGYCDFYFHALPLLKKKGIPAAVFVVTDLLGTTRMQTHDKLYLLLTRMFGLQLKPTDVPGLLQRVGISSLSGVNVKTSFEATRLLLEGLPQAGVQQVLRLLESEVGLSEDGLQPFHSLTWDMLTAIHRAGITVGSHTRSHVLMTNENDHTLMEEAAGSREVLEKRLGGPVRHFAYPGGLFTQAPVDAVAAAGYRYGYTTCRHRDARRPMLTVPRNVLWENSCQDSRGVFSPAMLSCQIHRVFDWTSGCRQRHLTSQEA
jgi:peptidoglycan/xylan/chitin deacetylase (PgdA/CDA1 family)